MRIIRKIVQVAGSLLGVTAGAGLSIGGITGDIAVDIGILLLAIVMVFMGGVPEWMKKILVKRYGDKK